MLEDRCKFKENERDLVLLHHRIRSRGMDGSSREIQARLEAYGDERHSAMARTVGIPVGIAARLLGEKAITQKGVLAPVTPQIYRPMLQELAQHNIKFQTEYK